MQHDTNNKQFFNKLGFPPSHECRSYIQEPRSYVLEPRSYLLEPTLDACHNLGPMLLQFMFRHSYTQEILKKTLF